MKRNVEGKNAIYSVDRLRELTSLKCIRVWMQFIVGSFSAIIREKKPEIDDEDN